MSEDAKSLGTNNIPDSTSASLKEGYNQTYVIFPNSHDAESKVSHNLSEVFFRCGNWCYKGEIDFSGVSINISDLPILIPMLQRQQNSLRYYCQTADIPTHTPVFEPLDFIGSACEFIAEEITSAHVEAELKKWSSIFSWIDDDDASTYFELAIEPPDCLKNVTLVASKTYNRGLIVISIYFENVIYFVLQNGEGDQHLLDVRFPNVSSHGQGLHISSYREDMHFWKKLTLWHTIDSKVHRDRENPKFSTTNLSSSKYIQSYCIAKSESTDSNGALSVYHDVLFRFGSWCYAGKVQLTPVLTLRDVPYVIPALRMQQSRLNYFCDVNRMPNSSPFTKPLDLMQKLAPIVEEEIYKSENVLNGLIERLSRMGLGESISKWLEGDSSNSFFEFLLAATPEYERIFKRIELIATKTYHPSGITTIMIYFQRSIYVTVLESADENPLLDSRFPDVSAKGRGYQLASYPNGLENWEALRKITIWQTVSSLEQEFRDRAAALAEAKKELTGDNPVRDSDECIDETDIRSRTAVETSQESNNNMKKSSSQTFTEHDDSMQSVFDDEYDFSAKKTPSKQTSDETPKKASHKYNNDVTPDQRKEVSVSELEQQNEKKSSLPAKELSSPITPISSRLAVARPHHLPKVDALSKKLDQIRLEMGEEVRL